MKLEINYRKKTGKKPHKHTDTKQHAPKKKNNGSTKKIKEEIKKYRDKWKWKYNIPKSMGWSKSSSKKEVYSAISLHRKQEKSQTIYSYAKGTREKNSIVNKENQ